MCKDFVNNADLFKNPTAGFIHFLHYMILHWKAAALNAYFITSFCYL